MGTLSKAIGTSGGYVAGTATFKEYLINTSKAFIYTTAQPPAIAAAASAAIQIIQHEPARLERLRTNRNALHAALTDLGFQLTDSQSPILPIIVKSPETAVNMSQALYKAGVYVPAIRPPDRAQTQQPTTPHHQFGTYARAIGDRGAENTRGRTNVGCDLKHEGNSQGTLVREKDLMKQKLCIARYTR